MITFNLCMMAHCKNRRWKSSGRFYSFFSKFLFILLLLFIVERVDLKETDGRNSDLLRGYPHGGVSNGDNDVSGKQQRQCQWHHLYHLHWHHQHHCPASPESSTALASSISSSASLLATVMATATSLVSSASAAASSSLLPLPSALSLVLYRYVVLVIWCVLW